MPPAPDKDDHHDQRVRGRAIIVEPLGERLWRARLPNGKLILAFYARLRVGRPLAPGDEVTVALSLYDFSEGEIVDSGALCSDGGGDGDPT
jgi:translation initiation factor IF-1